MKQKRQNRTAHKTTTAPTKSTTGEETKERKDDREKEIRK